MSAYIRFHAMLALLVAPWAIGESHPARSAETVIECPKSVPTESMQPLHPPKGWLPVVQEGLYLSSVGMLHGPPNESAVLRPDEILEDKKPGRELATYRWRLPQPQWFETWVYCGYGGGNSAVQLFHRIPTHIAACTATLATATLPSKAVTTTAQFICQ